MIPPSTTPATHCDDCGYRWSNCQCVRTFWHRCPAFIPAFSLTIPLPFGYEWHVEVGEL